MTERMSASQVGRQIFCHASANLEKAILGYQAPVEDRTANNAANRGTNMHEILAKIMELSNPDMQAITKAVDYVAEVRSRRRFKVLIEQKIKATWLIGEPETTVDLVLYTQDEIHVIDWKTGKIPVPVVDNEQLKFYAVCFAHLAPRAKGVTTHIVQPWANNIDWCWVSTEDLRVFMDEARRAEREILMGDVSFGPSHHCEFCPANPHSRGRKGNQFCPVLLNILYPPVVDEAEILNL